MCVCVCVCLCVCVCECMHAHTLCVCVCVCVQVCACMHACCVGLYFVYHSTTGAGTAPIVDPSEGVIKVKFSRRQASRNFLVFLNSCVTKFCLREMKVVAVAILFLGGPQAQYLFVCFFLKKKQKRLALELEICKMDSNSKETNMNLY